MDRAQYREHFESYYGKSGQKLIMHRLPSGEYRSMVTQYAWVAFLSDNLEKDPNKTKWQWYNEDEGE